MISPEQFISFLEHIRIDFAAGVPDSTFKQLIQCFYHETGNVKHINCSNECEAMAVCAGYHLATGKVPIVYMQNSGFGKIVNPYSSLTAKEAYSIPFIALIGWRGEPGVKDEPQHKMMGRITPDLLKTLEIKYSCLSSENWQNQLSDAKDYCLKNSVGYAFLIKKDLFESVKSIKDKPKNTLPLREQVIEAVVKNAPTNSIFVSSTGKASRELYEIRDKLKMNHQNDFYTIGSMGCASAIALGITQGINDRPVIIIDGDGAAIMQAGTFAALGKYGQNKSITHIIIDNGLHESTGGQPTLSENIDFEQISKSCNYQKSVSVDSIEALSELLKTWDDALRLIVVKTGPGSRADLGRPKTTPVQNKKAFMEFIRNNE